MNLSIMGGLTRCLSRDPLLVKQWVPSRLGTETVSPNRYQIRMGIACPIAQQLVLVAIFGFVLYGRRKIAEAP